MRDLCEAIATGGMDQDELFEFVRCLDEYIGEWDFTLRLCEHFGKLTKEHAKEEEEDRAHGR